MSTKTKVRSPFQAADDFTSVFALHRSEASTGPEEKSEHLGTASIEYVNAERTIAVTSGYRSYDVIVRTDLAPSDVVTDTSDVLTSEYYTDRRDRGVWYRVLGGIGSKTAARQAAERLLGQVQDVARPLHVALDGKYAPALTIALASLADKSEYRRDQDRAYAVSDIAEEARIDPRLLALAIKEDRLEWATPPVAPAQVMVVVRESATANLSERLVDEITLATREVPDLGRIVFEGSVSQFLLRQRQIHQQSSVQAILTQRERTQDSLKKIQARVQRLLDEIDQGQIVGRGLHDTLRLAEEVETAQGAATAYATEVANADLPTAFLAGLLRNEYAEQEDARFRYLHSDVRDSIKALAAINGMPLDRDRY